MNLKHLIDGKDTVSNSQSSSDGAGPNESRAGAHVFP